MDEIATESRLTRLETKLDILISRAEGLATKEHFMREMSGLEKRLDEHAERLDGHDKFRDNINQKVAWVAGAFGVIFTGFSYAAKYVWHWMTGTPN